MRSIHERIAIFKWQINSSSPIKKLIIIISIWVSPPNFITLVSILIFIFQGQCNRKTFGRFVKILRLVISQQCSDHLLVASQTPRNRLAKKISSYLNPRNNKHNNKFNEDSSSSNLIRNNFLTIQWNHANKWKKGNESFDNCFHDFLPYLDTHNS